MSKTMPPLMEAAGFHGLATNKALPVEERLNCALRALALHEAELDRLAAKDQTGAKTIEIKGVWLIKSPAHNGNRLEVLVETADGKHHVAITEVADDGPISHYVHPSGIQSAPVREFTEG